jgi:tetratricopeptide (TPR) repeat protein
MQAVFERSWQMMTPAEQAVMVKLSVFRGSFTRDAAEQVAGANLRLLLSLVNKSLLHRQAKSGRFTMQELLRQFAGEQRRDGAAAEQISRAHCRYFAQLVAREVRRAVSFHPMHFPQQFAADRDNIRRAWSFAVTHGLAWELSSMVKGMVAFSFAQGIPPAAIPAQAIESLRSHGVSETDHEMLNLRLNAFGYRLGQEDQTVLRPQFMKFVAVVEEYGDPEMRFWTYERMASLALDFDEIREADELFEKAQKAALESGDELLIKAGDTLDLAVLSYLELLDSMAETKLQALLAYFEPDFPNSFAVYSLLGALSAYYLMIEAYDQAILYGNRIRNLAKGWRDLLWITQANDQLVDIYLQMKRFDQAGSLDLDSLEWHQAIGQNWQLLGFLWGKSVYASQLFGGVEIVVPMLSMIYHHPDTTPFHKYRAAEDSLQFEPEMGAETYAAAWERGKGLDLETAVAQVRAILESAGDNP